MDAALASRSYPPEPIPLDPPDGMGIVTPGCGDRSELLFVTKHAGIGLRIGGEGRLCFECGPWGGVYHPSVCDCQADPRITAADCGHTSPINYSMADCRRWAGRFA